MPVSTALVACADPARLIRRVSNHFRHRVSVDMDGDDACVAFPDAPCTLKVATGAIAIRLATADEATSDRLHEVIAKHLKQVAVPESLAVDWVTEST